MFPKTFFKFPLSLDIRGAYADGLRDVREPKSRNIAIPIWRMLLPSDTVNMNSSPRTSPPLT